MSCFHCIPVTCFWHKCVLLLSHFTSHSSRTSHASLFLHVFLFPENRRTCFNNGSLWGTNPYTGLYFFVHWCDNWVQHILGKFQKVQPKPFHHSLVQVGDKKRRGMTNKVFVTHCVAVVCNSSTDQCAGLSCESVSSKCVSCFLNSGSMRQLCHTWLRRFRQPQQPITTAKSLMSCCTVLEYLIPQAALLCIYVNSEHP